MKKLIKSNSGFTMLELIIVIAIMGIISAIAIPSLFGTFNDMKKRADSVTAVSISHAVMSAYIDGQVNLDDEFQVPASSGDDIAPYLSNSVTIKPQSVPDTVFWVRVKDEGKCQIWIKKTGVDIEVYPDPATGY